MRNKLLPILAITIPVVLLGLVGWYVYDGYRESQDFKTNIQNNANVATTENVNQQANTNVTANTNTATYTPPVITPITEFPGVHDQLCPLSMLGERNNEYNPYADQYYTLNQCHYDTSTDELYGYYSSYDQAKGCADTLKSEIAKNRFNILDGCMYDQGSRLFEKTIHNMIIDGEFGDSVKIGEAANEWFRFVSNNNMYFFFVGGAGCGGCSYAGPFLKINLQNGSIEKNTYNDIPYPPNVEISLDKTQAIVLSGTQGSGENAGELYLYNFLTGEKVKTILQLVSRDGYQVCGDGCYLADGVVTWVDSQTVSIQKFKMDEENTYTLKTVSDGENSSHYIPDGDPVIINL